VVYEILPGQLFQLGKLHSTPLEKKLAGFEHYRIAHMVSLAPRTPDPDLYGSTMYRHQPIPDGKLAEDLLPLAAICADTIRDPHAPGILTSCNAGRNRSGLLSALIVRELTGLPGAAAMEVVRYHRPNAIANPHFEAFLRSLP
jgi:hypothetical protein